MNGAEVQPGPDLTPQGEPLDVGPYGLRGKDSPPLVSMFGGYAIIFAAFVLVPLILFILLRFVIL